MTRTEQPLLSICIPTFNRARYLKKNIDSIVRQPEFQDGSVEIVVSDNVSEDATQALCESYAARFANFRYFRNEKNIRDANFPLALSRGRGVLRRLVNDNRVLYPDALAYMCRVIRAYEDTKPVLFFADRSHTCDEDTGLLSFAAFLEKASFVMTWIGAFSVWDEDCDGIAQDTAYCDLGLWQVDKLCRLVEQKSGVVLQHKCLSYLHVAGKMDFAPDMFQVYHDTYFQILSPYRERGKISDALWEHLERDQLYYALTRWAIMWECGGLYSSSGAHSRTELRDKIFAHFHDKPYFDDYVQYYEKAKRAIVWKERIKKYVLNELLDLYSYCHDRP